MDSTDVENKPYLFEKEFTLPGSLTGLTVRYKLKATNFIGSTYSYDFLTAILAGIPPAPITGPADDATVTSSS